jgi:DNA-binding transcriptional LysR family regulator
MNTSYLRTFIEVINLKNISKAAEKLFITQPAVTKQLQLLEKDFGAELFVKNGREIVPTEEGHILYKYAKDVLSGESRIYSQLRKNSDSISGNITVYTSSMPADYYIHDLIIRFNKLYPDTTYTIKKVDTEMVFKNIEEGFTSFGFTGSLPRNKKIESICIAEDEVVIAASAEMMSEIKDGKITPAEFTSYRFIVREKGSATLRMFEDFLATKRMKLSDLNIIIQAEDNHTIKKFISNNLGLAVLPKKAVEEEVREKRAFILNVEGMNLKRKLYYVYQPDRYFSKAEEKFKEFMTKNKNCIQQDKNK